MKEERNVNVVIFSVHGKNTIKKCGMYGKATLTTKIVNQNPQEKCILSVIEYANRWSDAIPVFWAQ